MPDSASLLKTSLVVLVGLVVIRSQAWRAVIVLWPTSVRVDAEDPSEVAMVPDALGASWSVLVELGFRWLGTHSEQPLGGPATLFFDAVHPEALAFASLFLHEGQPRILLLTGAEQGFVLTCDYQRVARAVEGRYLAGGLEGVGPQRLFKAHQRRVAELGAPQGEASLEGRVELGRRWYRGPGRADLRLQHAVGLLWTLGGLLVVIAGAYGLWGE